MRELGKTWNKANTTYATATPRIIDREKFPVISCPDQSVMLHGYKNTRPGRYHHAGI
jgi:hypothetical protein